MNRVVRSSNLEFLIADIVGVRALAGVVCCEEAARFACGVPIDKKSGVGPNGEYGSGFEADRDARYGRFQCMNLDTSVSSDHNII